MALQSFGGRIYAPDYPAVSISGVPATVNITVDADGEGYGMVFHAPETGLITGMGAPTGGTVTTGDAGMIWQLESVTVSATPAIPSGTIISAGVVGNTNPAIANTWYDATFGTSYNATKGELLAAVIKRPTSGAFNGQIKGFGVERGAVGIGFPYLVVNAGAGWIANQAASPCIAINYGGTYHMIRGSWPMSTITANAINNTTTPDVVGARWIPRIKCRVTGVWSIVNAGVGAYVIKFYDVDGVTVLASVTVATNERPVNSTQLQFFPLNTTVTPVVGSTYWIGVEPSSATSVSVYDYTAPSSAIMAVTTLGGDFYFDSAKDPSGTGSWTGANALRRPFLGLAIDQLDDGVQVGGGGARNVYIGRGMAS